MFPCRGPRRPSSWMLLGKDTEGILKIGINRVYISQVFRVIFRVPRTWTSSKIWVIVKRPLYLLSLYTTTPVVSVLIPFVILRFWPKEFFVWLSLSFTISFLLLSPLPPYLMSNLHWLLRIVGSHTWRKPRTEFVCLLILFFCKYSINYCL